MPDLYRRRRTKRKTALKMRNGRVNADVTVIISTILKADTHVQAANHINKPSFPHHDQMKVVPATTNQTWMLKHSQSSSSEVHTFKSGLHVDQSNSNSTSCQNVYIHGFGIFTTL